METIVWKGRLGPMNLAASPATFRPTTITHLLADALEVRRGDVVIDVGCGLGVLGVIAAKLGASKVYGVDMSPDVVEVCTTSAVANGVADRMEFFHGDLFEPLPDGLRADIIIGDVSGVRLVDEGVVQLGKRGSRLLWEARVWLCRADAGAGAP